MRTTPLDVRNRAIGPVALLLAMAGTVREPGAQTILHEWLGTNQPGLGDMFGWWIAGVGDVDGDGVADVAVGAPSTNVGTMTSAGRLYVFSGRDGSTLFTLNGSVPYEGFATYVTSAGDMDRDGHADILVPSVSGWLVLSGLTGTTLRSYPGYSSAVGVGDVDGDGWPDVFLGWTEWNLRPPGAGFSELLSGRTGSLIYRFTGTFSMQGFGDVWPSGDFDADGVPDLLVSAEGVWPSTGADGIWVYSGSTGGLLFRVAPPPGTDSFPWAVSGVGDTNGDGFDDVVLSDFGVRTSSNYSHVLAFDGPGGAPAFMLQGSTNLDIGWQLAGPGDVDGDGFDDVLTIGVTSAGGTATLLYSGQNQSLLMSLPTGARCASLGDVNGDDFPDLLVGFIPHSFGNVTKVRVYSGAPTGITTVGQGCADPRGVVPRIGCTYVPRRGGPFSINLSRVRSTAPVFLVLGLSNTAWNNLALPYELSSLGMPGCFLRTSTEVAAFSMTAGPAAKGRASIPMWIPNDPALAGRSLYAQWLVLEPPGAAPPASTTRALTVTVQ